MSGNGLMNGGLHSDNAPASKLRREELYSLEQYAGIRPLFRAKVIEHKKNRQVAIGPHATLSFEDRLTMHYQVQEMLRVERIFEPEGIEQEIEAYNPLIPDGSNWKATFLLEYPDAEERRVALEGLKGIEDRVWVRAEGFEPVWAIADEDLERENDTKTSSVHFLRFQLDASIVAAIKRGAAVRMGIDHARYRHEVMLSATVRDSLAADLIG
ncbi:MAG TPA: DUF3501 family protein [Burkholderiales bacterium]|nr:DUF3501 family protein [Burkholderiales bacterium]